MKSPLSPLALFAVGLLSTIPAPSTLAQDKPAAPASPATSAGTAAPAPHDYARWEKEIAAMEAADRESPPPKEGLLFIGSSTIRLWKTLAEDFPNRKLVNRGFGGSEIVDSTYYADRLIFPHEPKKIFLRAGGNDIHDGRLPREVAADFAEFVRVVHARLPKTEILYIGLNPSPARWGEVDKGREMNRLIREMALEMPFVGYIDTDDMTVDEDGRAKHDLFVEDGLHLSRQGYTELTVRVAPYLGR